jgi:hypothetical protein
MAAKPTQQQQQPATSMSMEAVFVSLYVDALRKLESTWMDSENVVDEAHFNMQLEFLIRLIPNGEIQNTIREERDEQIKLFKDEDFADQRAGLVVVTHLIKFLTQSFDLLHVDIWGPSISSQFRAATEVPDMPLPAPAPAAAIIQAPPDKELVRAEGS